MKKRKKFRYVISDIAGWLLYHVIKYRKTVITTNLTNSFPEKSPEEVDLIKKKFYYWLSDILFEIIFGVSKLDIQYKNTDLPESLYRKNKSIIIVASHFNNWESLVDIATKVPHKLISAYQPLKNRFFDKFLKDHRERLGVEMIPSNKIFQTIMTYKAQNIPTVTVMLADQSPAKVNVREWITFLNQPTPIFFGPERIAQKTGHAVVYMHIEKPYRGAYEVYFKLICEDPSKMAHLEISQRYYKILESAIRENPEMWLWSHKRWKHIDMWREQHGNALPPMIS